MPISHRGRLAPSPTGALHVGNARTFLVAWVAARAAGGTIALRIEDIDGPRVKPEATRELIEDLTWLGLDWDGEPVVQTQRLPIYEAAFEQLKAKNFVYPCTCSRSDVAQAASAPHAEHEGPAYPGTCSRRSPEDARNLDAAGRVYSWRFRVTDSPSFIDGFAGPVSIDLRQIGGDFVVWKSSGTPAYQLAVVVDDALMNVTDVIRGDDLLASTPRQLLLQQALGYGSPQYVHVPLVVGPDGRRLAKRHGDTRLWTLRDRGLRADVLCGFLAHSLGWQATPAAGPAKDLVKRWNLSGIPRAPYVLTPEAVDAMLVLSRR